MKERANAVKIPFNGTEVTVKELTKIFGLSRTTLNTRIRKLRKEGKPLEYCYDSSRWERPCIKLEYEGNMLTLAEFALATGYTVHTIRARLKRNKDKLLDDEYWDRRASTGNAKDKDAIGFKPRLRDLKHFIRSAKKNANKPIDRFIY